MIHAVLLTMKCALVVVTILEMRIRGSEKTMPSDILSGIIADLRVLIDQIDNNFKTLKELLLEVAGD
jgi:hypothetical protein